MLVRYVVDGVEGGWRVDTWWMEWRMEGGYIDG